MAIKIYCRKIVINKPEYLQAKGPLLFAANHPNSFLDGMILTTLLENDLYSLARGDVFKNKRWNKLLRRLRLLPVYRTSEGVENLGHNYTTFAACQDVFSNKGMVMIFSEGKCFNEWHLRPLKKGTARLAISTWQKSIDLKVIPVGFNYSPFRVFGKNIYINFGEVINKQAVLEQRSEGKQLLQFTTQLNNQLKELVYEIHPQNKQTQKEKLYQPQPLPKRITLFIPAVLGAVIHAPLYFPVKWIADAFFNNDHYDSVVNSLLMLLYPLYLFILFFIAASLFNWWVGLLIFFLIPFCAWAFVQVKRQVD